MNAKELGDMPAFPLPVIKDDKGHPMVHAHPYNHGMTIREVVAAVALHGVLGRTQARPVFPETLAAAAIQSADVLLDLLAKDTE